MQTPPCHERLLEGPGQAQERLGFCEMFQVHTAMKLFQNLSIAGYAEGLDHDFIDFQIPACTFLDTPLDELF